MHYKQRTTDPKWLPPLRSLAHPDPTTTRAADWETDPQGIIVFDTVPDVADLAEEDFGDWDEDACEDGAQDPYLDGGSGTAGARTESNTTFSPADIVSAVRTVASKLVETGLPLPHSDLEEWDDWLTSCPTQLSEVAPEMRASLEMPTPFDPEGDVQRRVAPQVELISYDNAKSGKGGRVDVKKLRQERQEGAHARRIEVKQGHFVVVRRPKPCPRSCDGNTPANPAWNTPFWIGKVVAIDGKTGGINLHWYCPHSNQKESDDVNAPWRGMTLDVARNGSRKYIDTIDNTTDSVGAVITFVSTGHLSAQAIKDIVDLQDSLCPPGSPELFSMPPFRVGLPGVSQGPGRARWHLGIRWAGEDDDDDA